jgi:tRNA pseudouridine55 synthase/H/ACA ribonucleoprotein complex subunit 4
LRIREIHSIECLDSDGLDVLLLVRCDSGTYIRSLCHHIGLALGVGGHMQELRRTISGGFSETKIHTLHSLADAMDAARNGDFTTLSQMILPVEVISSGIPCVSVKTTALNAISHGARISSRGIVALDSFQKDDFVAVLNEQNNEQKIVCIGRALISSSGIKPGAYALVIAPFLVFRDFDP